MAIEVGILGATGMVGQQFIALLANHPWFKVDVARRERAFGGQGVSRRRGVAAAARRCRTTVARWRSNAATPGGAPQLVFSGLDSSVAGEIEGAFAQAGHIIVSNSRNYRMEADVPLLIPEVNADHLALLDAQGAGRGWKGRIVTNPNCVVDRLAMALAPLRQFGLKTSMITTLQAISGAGYPGVASWDILGNVIPFIGGGEEEKIETETKKILGSLQQRRGRQPSGDDQRHDDARAGAQRPHRIDFGRARAAARCRPRSSTRGTSFRGKPQELELPSAPPQPIVYLTERIVRSPRSTRNRDGGMTVTVGRLRRCPVLDYKFVALGHNTIRGAAGAAILNAELMHREGLL